MRDLLGPVLGGVVGAAAGPESREIWAEHGLKEKTHGRHVYPAATHQSVSVR